MSLAHDTDAVAGVGHNLRDPLDVEFDVALRDFQTDFDERNAQAERAKVGDDETAVRATTLAGVLADIASKAEKKRVEMKDPYLAGCRKIDERFKKFVDTVTATKRRVLGLIDAYQAEVERKAEAERQRLAAEARAKEEAARKAEAEGNALAAARLEQEAEETAARVETVAAAPAQPIRTGYGFTGSTRTDWHSQIVDVSKLPSTVTNHPKVKEAMESIVAGLVRGGAREIPGCRIWSEKKTVVGKR